MPYSSASFRFCRAAILWTAFVGGTSLAVSCSSSVDGPSGPGDPSSISMVTISPPSGSVDVGSTDTLTATALLQDGAAVGNASIAITHSSPSVAFLEVAGSTAFVTGVAPGTDTLTATVQSPHNPIVSKAVITVTTPTARVAQIRFPARLIVISPSQGIPVAPTITDQAGNKIGAADVNFVVSPTSIGSVNGQGSFVAGVAGTGTITVTSNSHTDTLRVKVSGSTGDLPVALSDTVIRDGAPLTITSSTSLTGASVSIAARGAQVATSGAGGITTAPDPQTFASCVPIGTPASIIITASGSTRTVSLPLFSPALIAISIGDASTVSDAISKGCPISVAQPGTYLVMPFTWDQHESDRLGEGTSAPSVANVEVNVSFNGFAQTIETSGNRLAPSRSVGVPSFATAPLRSSGATLARVQHLPKRDVLAIPNRSLHMPTYRINPNWYRAVMAERGVRVGVIPGPVASLTPPTSGGACAIPLTLGATIQIGTFRLSDGTYAQPGAPLGSATDPTQGYPIEPWTLVGIGTKVAVFADTALVNAMPSMQGADVRLQKLAAAYDSTVAPFIERNSVGVEDRDGNGRVVVLVAKNAHNAYAFPTGYGRVDCQQAGNTNGEAIQPTFTDFFASDAKFQAGFAKVVSTLVHETSHLADERNVYFPANGTPRKETWWSAEGQAVLMQYLWAYGPDVSAGQAFSGNTAAPPFRTIEGSSTGAFCELSNHAVLTQWYQLSSYPLACQYTRYLFAQSYRVNPNQSIQSLYTTWANIPDRTSSGKSRSAMLGTATSDHDAMRDWLLSWYADGHVAGANPIYTDPSVDLRGWWSTWNAGQYPVPDANLTLGSNQQASLAEPDTRFFEATVAATGSYYFTISAPRGMALNTNNVDVAILRAK